MQAHLIPQETPRSIFVYFRGLFYDVNNDPEGGYYARYAHTELLQVACHNWVWKLWSGVLFLSMITILTYLSITTNMWDILWRVQKEMDY